MANNKYYHPDTDFFTKHGAAPPSATPHATEDEILERLRPFKPHSWHLEGNLLVGISEQGRVAQTIPPNYICKGADATGLPLLEKIVL